MKKLFVGTVISIACLSLTGCFSAKSMNNQYQHGDDSIYSDYDGMNLASNSTSKPFNPNFPTYKETGGEKMFIFDPNQTAWAAYDSSGNLVKTGAASGGRNYCPDIGKGCKTSAGTFRVYSKRGPDCKSSKYPVGKGGAPMPHCMFFKGGFAIHGSNDVPTHNASHGCVRVKPHAAKWLSDNFVDIGTKVQVKHY